MKDRKNIRKLLYLSEKDICLIVFEPDQHNILFADQVKIFSEDLKPRILELLTNAANFLGFNIKDVEVIFDDEKITKYNYTNYEFVDCNSEDDIAKEIFKKAKIDNYFVNEINFMGVTYDEIDKVAKVNCQVCASDYITYKKYINAVKACNLNITNSTNLYKLLKANKEQIELTLKIGDNKVIACEYYGEKLNNVKVVNLDVNEIKQHLSDKFNIEINKMDEVIELANDLINQGDLDVTLVRNYNLKTKSFNLVNANDFVALYRDEIRTQINNYVDIRLFQSVSVLSSHEINALDGFNFIKNEDLCFDNISSDKIIALDNIDKNKEINQFNFENKIRAIDLTA